MGLKISSPAVSGGQDSRQKDPETQLKTPSPSSLSVRDGTGSVRQRWGRGDWQLEAPMGPDLPSFHPCPSIGAWVEPPPLRGPRGERE